MQTKYCACELFWDMPERVFYKLVNWYLSANYSMFLFVLLRIGFKKIRYRQGETLVPETDESGPTEVHLYFETDPMPEEFVLVAGEGELHQVFVLAADTDADRAKQDYDEG